MAETRFSKIPSRELGMHRGFQVGVPDAFYLDDYRYLNPNIRFRSWNCDSDMNIGPLSRRPAHGTTNLHLTVDDHSPIFQVPIEMSFDIIREKRLIFGSKNRPLLTTVWVHKRLDIAP